MRNKTRYFALGAMLLALSFPAEAQQPTKVPRIGFLAAGSSASSTTRVEAFRQGLRELGYVEGKNILIEYRYAEEKLDRLPKLATELVRLKVDVIITGGPGVLSAKDASKTTPIVMTDIGDPVGVGLVASLAHPGGNVTGLSTLAKEENNWNFSRKPSRASPSWRSFGILPTLATRSIWERRRSRPERCG